MSQFHRVPERTRALTTIQRNGGWCDRCDRVRGAEKVAQLDQMIAVASLENDCNVRLAGLADASSPDNCAVGEKEAAPVSCVGGQHVQCIVTQRVPRMGLTRVASSNAGQRVDIEFRAIRINRVAPISSISCPCPVRCRS